MNVGGNGNIAMADLREFFDALGFGNARTLIQTGNVIFESDTSSGAELEVFLEQEALNRLGLDTTFLIRTPGECMCTPGISIFLSTILMGLETRSSPMS